MNELSIINSVHLILNLVTKKDKLFRILHKLLLGQKQPNFPDLYCLGVSDHQSWKAFQFLRNFLQFTQQRGVHKAIAQNMKQMNFTKRSESTLYEANSIQINVKKSPKILKLGFLSIFKS
jgi:hypothetical protein